MLYYRVVITSGVDHGYILYILHMIHVVTKVGSGHRVPASDSDVGAEGAGGSIQVVVPDDPRLLICGGAAGQVETT